ncbi:MAG: aromatic amino acid hydroxylase [Reichenbachiella sp.]
MTDKTPYFGNSVIDKLPMHLRGFIKPQNYDDYSAIDQAVWRYVMRKNIHFLKNVAHDSYLQGLKETGIDVDHIPNMYGMNRILKKIGWAAVAVDGFIPPAAFMDFQAYNVLVIASDIRQLEHIEYTPAPDIIHESAGHAPIIANREYSEFLRHFGEIGGKAISNKKDYELYEAIRHLSIIKEAPGTNQNEISKAQNQIAALSQNMGEPSEMALLRNLHWWTVEYGLIGTLDNPKIYGAGLLSSIGESTSCLKDDVKKIPFSLAAAYQHYDITQTQPQLFVTPDFAQLSMVLEEFTNTLALRTGGLSGLKKLIDSGELGSIELSTGLQVSGIFDEYLALDGQPIYFHTKGKTALANREKQLIGHGTDQYPEGIGSPIGKLKGINLSIEDMSPRDLQAYDIHEGNTITLDFEGDISLTGEVLTGQRNLQGKIMLITFRNCLVKLHDQILHNPDTGLYHMAVGKEIVSAFNGPADLSSFVIDTHVPSEETIRVQKSTTSQRLENLYGQIRNYRNEASQDTELLQSIFQELMTSHPHDWLLCIELLELTKNIPPLEDQIIQYLYKLELAKPALADLISSGIDIIQMEESKV